MDGLREGRLEGVDARDKMAAVRTADQIGEESSARGRGLDEAARGSSGASERSSGFGSGYKTPPRRCRSRQRPYRTIPGS